MKLKVILEPSEDGGYTVFVPSLPGCISEGDTVEDALANIREAIELYLEPVDDDITIPMLKTNSRLNNYLNNKKKPEGKRHEKPSFPHNNRTG